MFDNIGINYDYYAFIKHLRQAIIAAIIPNSAASLFRAESRTE